jgi:hypothetical protein
MGSRSASRSGAWAEAAAGDGAGVTGSAPSDPSAIAVPETRTAGGGNAVSRAADRMLALAERLDSTKTMSGPHPRPGL